jgi:hypothetical protein
MKNRKEDRMNIKRIDVTSNKIGEYLIKMIDPQMANMDNPIKSTIPSINTFEKHFPIFSPLSSFIYPILAKVPTQPGVMAA